MQTGLFVVKSVQFIFLMPLPFHFSLSLTNLCWVLFGFFSIVEGREGGERPGPGSPAGVSVGGGPGPAVPAAAGLSPGI